MSEPLYDLFRTYSRVGGVDRDVRDACREIIAMFDAAQGDRETFVKAVIKAGRYSSFDPEEIEVL